MTLLNRALCLLGIHPDGPWQPFDVQHDEEGVIEIQSRTCPRCGKKLTRAVRVR